MPTLSSRKQSDATIPLRERRASPPHHVQGDVAALEMTISQKLDKREMTGPFQSPGWRPFTPNCHSGESRNLEQSEHSDLLDSRFRGNDGLTLKRPW
jgi:hypothetical protein